jgi:hypothetical protein
MRIERVAELFDSLLRISKATRDATSGQHY